MNIDLRPPLLHHRHGKTMIPADISTQCLQSLDLLGRLSPQALQMRSQPLIDRGRLVATQVLAIGDEVLPFVRRQ